MAKTVNVDFKSNFDSASLKTFISDVNRQLENINLSKAIKQDLTRNLGEIEKIMGRITNFNFKSRDATGFSSLVGQLDTQIGYIENRLKTLTRNDFELRIDSPDLQATRVEMEALEQQISKIRQASQNMLSQRVAESGLKREVKESISSVEDLQTQIRAMQSEFNNLSLKDVLTTNQLDRYGQYLDNLEETKQRVQELNAIIQANEGASNREKTRAAKDAGFSSFGDIRSQVGAMNTAIKLEEQYSQKLQQRQQYYQETIATLENINNSIEQQPAALQAAEQQLAQMQITYAQIEESVAQDLFSNQTSEVQKMAPAFATAEVAVKGAKEEVDQFALAVTRATGQEISSQITNFAMRWFGIEQALTRVTKIAKDAWNTYKQLDTQITGIAMVTGSTLQEAWADVPGYTQLARDLGITTADIAKQSEEFYRQGRNQAETMQLIEATTKMAAIANMDYGIAVDYMTAAINGFQLSAEDGLLVSDIFSRLDAAAATSVEDLAVAISKTASIAKSAGMELETTAAFLTQMIETTQEAPENIGTAMKSIIARMQELKESPMALLEDGVDANKTEAALREASVALRDANGEFRDLDDVLLELSSKWDGLTRNQQRYIATIVAGNRQQSRFIALMSDYERTVELVDIAYDAAGTSTIAFQKRLDSLNAAINQVTVSWENFYLNAGLVEFFTGAARAAAELIQSFSELGGLGTALVAALGFVAVRMTLTTISAVAAKQANDRLTTSQIAQTIASAGQAGGLKGVIGWLGALTGASTVATGATNALSSAALFLQASFLPLLALTAVVAAIGAIVYAATNAERQVRKFREELQRLESTATQSASDAKNLAALVERYEELTKVEAMNAEQKEELTSVSQQLAEIAPELVAGYNEEGEAILENIDLMREYLILKKEEANQDAIEVASKRFEGLAKGTDEAVLGINNAKTALNELNSAYVGYMGNMSSIGPSDMDELDREYSFASISNYYDEVQDELEKRFGDGATMYTHANEFYAIAEEITNNQISEYEKNIEIAAQRLEVANNKYADDATSLVAEQASRMANSITSTMYLTGEGLSDGQQQLLSLLAQQDLLGDLQKARNSNDTSLTTAFFERFDDDEAMEKEIARVRRRYLEAVQSINDIDLQQQILDLMAMDNVDIEHFDAAVAPIFDNLPEAIQRALEEKRVEIQSTISSTLARLMELTQDQIPQSTFDNLGSQLSYNLLQQLEKMDNPETRVAATRAVEKVFDALRGEDIDWEGSGIDINELLAVDPRDLDNLVHVQNTVADLMNLPFNDSRIVEMFSDMYQIVEAMPQGLDSTIQRIENFRNKMNELDAMMINSIDGTLTQDNVNRLLDLFPDLSMENFNFDVLSGGYELVGVSLRDLKDQYGETERALLSYQQVVLQDRMISDEALQRLQDRLAAEEALGHGQSERANQLREQISEQQRFNEQLEETTMLLSAMPDPVTRYTGFQEVTDSIQSYISNMEVLVAAQQELNENQQISFNTMMSLIEADAAYIDMIQIKNGMIMLDSDLLQQNMDAMEANAKASIDARITQLEGENELIQSRITTLQATLAILESEEMSYEEKKEALKNIWEQEVRANAAAELLKAEATQESVTAQSEATHEGVNSEKEAMGISLENIKSYTKAVVDLARQRVEANNKAHESIANDGVVAAEYKDVNASLVDSISNIAFDPIEMDDTRIEELLAEYEKSWEDGVNKTAEQIQANIDSLMTTLEGNEQAIANLQALRDMDWNESFAQTGGNLPSSGGSEKKAKEEEAYTTALERTYNVLRKLALAQQKLNELQKRSDLTKSGYEAHEFLSQQIEYMRQEIDIYKEAIAVQNESLRELRNQLETQYGDYVQFVGDMLTINYDAIVAVSQTATSDEMKEYLKTMEDLIDKYNKAQDAVSDYKSSMLDLEKTMRDIELEREQKVFDMENRLLQALISRDEKEVEQLRKKYDKMKALDISYLDSVKRMREKEKRLRDQERDLNDLAKMRQRLALLERDTSGAYDRERAELREQITEREVEMSENAKDQIIADMEDEMNRRHDNYDDDVEKLEKANEAKKENWQLYWDEVYEIMDQGAGAMMDTLMQYDEEFLKMSERQKDRWIEDMTKAAEEVEAILNGVSLPDYGGDNDSNGYDTSPNTPTSGKGGGSSTGNVTRNDGVNTGETKNFSGKIYATASDASSGRNGINPLYGAGPYTILGVQNGAAKVRYSKLSSGVTGWYPVSKAYKKGGLVDFTGPAWVDGSPSDPEAFLSANDTKMMRLFLDLFSNPQSLVNNISGSAGGGFNSAGDNLGKGGDLILNLEIDRIDSDYSVDRMMERVEERINEAGRYRNTISVQGIRR